MESNANKEVTLMLNDDFDRIIIGTLQLLTPTETQAKVVEVISNLSINHDTQKGRGVIRTIISEEKKKLVDKFVRKEKKVQAGIPLKRVSATKYNHVVPNSLHFKILAKVTE